jgi:hypothetical protein
MGHLTGVGLSYRLDALRPLPPRLESDPHYRYLGG